MKKHITVDYSKALAFINEEEIAKIGEEIKGSSLNTKQKQEKIQDLKNEIFHLKYQMKDLLFPSLSVIK